MTQSIAWDKVAHADVLRGLKEYDRLGPDSFFAAHGFASTTTYDLVWEETPLPAEGDPGHGVRARDGERLASGDFECGKTGPVRVLGKLGFTVQERQPATRG